MTYNVIPKEYRWTDEFLKARIVCTEYIFTCSVSSNTHLQIPCGEPVAPLRNFSQRSIKWDSPAFTERSCSDSFYKKMIGMLHTPVFFGPNQPISTWILKPKFEPWKMKREVWWLIWMMALRKTKTSVLHASLVRSDCFVLGGVWLFVSLTMKVLLQQNCAG